CSAIAKFKSKFFLINNFSFIFPLVCQNLFQSALARFPMLPFYPFGTLLIAEFPPVNIFILTHFPALV
ncbi:MAG: hypothetical protein ACFNUI_09560, partial [Negativicutes bacterium]